MFTDIIQKLCDEKGITVAKMLRDLDFANSLFSKWKIRGSIPSSDLCDFLTILFKKNKFKKLLKNA